MLLDCISWIFNYERMARRQTDEYIFQRDLSAFWKHLLLQDYFYSCRSVVGGCQSSWFASWSIIAIRHRLFWSSTTLKYSMALSIASILSQSWLLRDWDRAAGGSSSNTQFLLLISAICNEILCCCPPESCPNLLVATFCSCIVEKRSIISTGWFLP